MAASDSEARLAHLGGVVAAQFVHLLQRHLGRDRAQGAGELAFQQFAQAVGLQRAAAERLRGGGHQLAAGADTDEEFGDQVDAHAVLGDQRKTILAAHLDAQHVHVDRGDLVQHRNDEGAAIHHHLLAHEAGAHERRLLGRAAIEPAQDVDGDHHDDRGNDQPQQESAKGLRGHDLSSPRQCGRPGDRQISNIHPPGRSQFFTPASAVSA